MNFTVAIMQNLTSGIKWGADSLLIGRTLGVGSEFRSNLYYNGRGREFVRSLGNVR